jgi:5-methyltetrahydrofolate--homocysteine methyltransferase
MNRYDRFRADLEQRVIIFDGAMGTSIQNYNLSLEKDYLGKENLSEILLLTRPDVIREIHASFLMVGCDAIETDTFSGTRLVLGEYDMADQVREINVTAARLAREVAEEFSTPDRLRYVIGSMGPGTKSPSSTDPNLHLDFDTLYDYYKEQAVALIEGGVDVLLVETCFDLLQCKIGVRACADAREEAGLNVPIMAQVTMETTGTMLLGTEIGAAVTALEEMPVEVIGLNCATGPEMMTEHVRYLSENCSRKLSVLPNAGLPRLENYKTIYDLTPDQLASYHETFVKEYGVNIVGGCCGTTPSHLKAVVDRLDGAVPKKRSPIFTPSASSLYTSVPFKQESSILIVGERTNASGSKKCRDLLNAEDWDGLVSMAKDQVREGAHILDVNVDFVGRDGPQDMEEVISRFVNNVTLPLMLDSTQWPVMEAGLKHAGGKCILNSTNFEDGEERFAQVIELARRHGAAVVIGTIDETGMARTAEEKFAIAKRSYEIALEKYDTQPSNIFFDPLALPISTGLEDDRKSGAQTIEGIRRIKTELPGCYTLLGISNISFGLNPAARQVLNSVFMHYCVEAGLDAAIVNASKILPLNRIGEQEREVARQLIFDERRFDGEVCTYDPLAEFTSLFQGKTLKREAIDENLPIEEKLKRAIIDGERRNLEANLEEAMKTYPPLAIINDLLLDGMKVVGELFGSGQMQLPFVLQSAEVMKASVAYLEPFMERVEGDSKGKIVLATVKGDVHDIGKNLVDIILTNNGYTVYNLGIKQPIQNIIEATEQHKADAIGLSGLLVKSTVIMKDDLEELNTRGLDRYPVILGGAALTRSYVEEDLRAVYNGSVFYAQDAFEGLHLMEQIAAGTAVAGPAKPSRREERKKRLAEMGEPAGVAAEPVRQDIPVPKPPFWGSRMVERVPLPELFPYVNEVALFRNQWQFKRGEQSREEFNAYIEETVRPIYNDWKSRVIKEDILRPSVAYGYFPCQSQGNDVIVYHPDTQQEWQRFTFPRQPGRRRLCIADFFKSVESGETDVIGMSVVTVGRRASEVTAKLFAENQYADYLYLHGLSVETAEALAEYWHKRMREELGIADEDAPAIRELFQQKYRGSRYSFGYPACPNLEDQTKLFELLQPERINVTLTEEFEMEPEQSTSAIIVHHPQAKYFTIE